MRRDRFGRVQTRLAGAMALSLSWLERRPVTAEVVGSSPISVAIAPR